MSLRLIIERSQEDRSYQESFELSLKRVTTLLQAFYEIKSELDATFTFDAGCKSGVCGACAVRVNGREELACAYQPKDGDRVEALKYHKILRDLKVQKREAHSTLKRIIPPAKSLKSKAISPKEEVKFRIQSDCILCDSCYSVCPVLAVNPNFLAPFALSRAWRYIQDPRVEADKKTKLSYLQQDAIWDCTLCGECTAVCPQGLDPKNDIMQLRGESLKAGFDDPNFSTQNFGVPDFSGGFGF